MSKFFDLLPEKSFAYLNTTGEIIMIKRGEKGYYPQPNIQDRYVDDLNNAFGVTKEQAEAMVAGSMFGWDVPAANPKLYEDEKHKGKFTHNRKPDWAK
jgi:hypothetical protein